MRNKNRSEKRYYCIITTNEIGEYSDKTAGYELKGLLRAYGDKITAGFKEKEKAEKWLQEWKWNAKKQCQEKIVF